jgi:endonuclease YncB( thermonuclease family)
MRVIAFTLAAAFTVCSSSPRITCVVDGDTFWLNGEKVRIADINAPETSRPGCIFEAELGERAKLRLLALLNSGRFELERGPRDRDRYGRLLRTVRQRGRSLGAVLVAEGLAEPWRGRRSDWCAGRQGVAVVR